MGFFKICLEELNDFTTETIKYTALANRAASATAKDFDKFMSANTDSKKEAKAIKVDHEALVNLTRGNKNGIS